MPVSTLAKLALALGALYILKILLARNRPLAPLPPGPRGKFLIGNLADLPPRGAQDWQHWLKHKDLYGPISSVTVLGQTIVILNDPRLAVELLDKRSAAFSSRPRLVFASELVGWEHGMAMLPYSARFRAYRKAMHRTLGSTAAVARFNALQELEARRFLLRALDAPHHLLRHIRTFAGATILKIAYGYTVEPHARDPLVALADAALAQFSVAATPGVWAVDVVPMLKYLPAWFPGAGFQRTAQRWRSTLRRVADVPYAFVKRQMHQGTDEPSFLAGLLQPEEPEAGSEEEMVAKWSAASLYSGGADTTVSSLACFFLAMALYPDVQRKAQEEIDRVIGTARLPGCADRDRLPYVDAVVKEVLRWHPVAPMGLPHMSTEAEVCEGYRIPRGAVVLANIWGFMHDPTIYHDPTAFKPERFLRGDHPEPDPHGFAFGFGRRICPGRLLADTAVFLGVAQALAVFVVSKPVEDGKEVDLAPRFQPGVISHPEPYGVRLEVRGAAHEALVGAVEREWPWEESHARELDLEGWEKQ